METVKSFLQGAAALREKLQGLSRFRKALLLVLIVAIPAGIAIAMLLLLRWKVKDR